jgi:very-short-patch-repair endonuclease
MLYYEKKELERKARVLRNNMTKAEIILWSRIRSKQINGHKFRRQQPLFNYIVDFYCNELKLIIEVDGAIHSDDKISIYDRKRDNILKINGFHILRLSNTEVETNIDSSIDKINLFISGILSPSHKDHRGPDENSQKKLNSSLVKGDHRGSKYD